MLPCTCEHWLSGQVQLWATSIFDGAIEDAVNDTYILVTFVLLLVILVIGKFFEDIRGNVSDADCSCRLSGTGCR